MKKVSVLFILVACLGLAACNTGTTTPTPLTKVEVSLYHGADRLEIDGILCRDGATVAIKSTYTCRTVELAGESSILGTDLYSAPYTVTLPSTSKGYVIYINNSALTWELIDETDTTVVGPNAYSYK